MKTRRLLSLLLALALLSAALPAFAAENAAVYVRLKKDAALYADRELTELLGTLDEEAVAALLEQTKTALRIQTNTTLAFDEAWVSPDDAVILSACATPTDLLPVTEPEEKPAEEEPIKEKPAAEEPEPEPESKPATASEPAEERNPGPEPKPEHETKEPKAEEPEPVVKEPEPKPEPKPEPAAEEPKAEKPAEEKPVPKPAAEPKPEPEPEPKPEPAAKEPKAEEPVPAAEETKPAEEEPEPDLPFFGSRREPGPTNPDDLPETARPGASEPLSASGALYTMSEDGTLVTAKYTDETETGLPAGRNQNPYGACWDFAIVGAMEIDLITDNQADTSIDLSEFFVAYFSAHNAPYAKGGDEGDTVTGIVGSYFAGQGKNYLDIGGNTRMAYYILSALVGTTAEEDNPFPDPDRTDQDKTVESFDIAAQLTGTYYLPTAEDGSPDREAIREAIRSHGSVKVSMWMPTLGVGRESYRDQENNAVYGTYTGTNHDVLLVGWDDNYSRNNFDSRLKPKANGAWRVRNSYGSGWGDGGYFWLSYEDKSLSTPVAVDAENGGDISSYCYSYVKVPQPYTYAYGSEASAEVVQSFTVDAGEKLHAVGVETMDDGYTLSAEVKVNGKTVATAPAVKAAYKGFHQLKLSPAWAVDSRTEVEVVVTYTAAAGKTAIVPYQYAGENKPEDVNAKTLDYAYTTDVAGGGFTLDGREIYGDSTIRLYTRKNKDTGLLTAIRLNRTSLSLKTAEYADLSVASWTPSNATNKDVRWFSSDNAVACIADDKSGRVVGGGQSGTATVTAMSSNGVFATCTVTVEATAVAVTGIEISGFSDTYTIDETTMPGAKLGDELRLDAVPVPRYAPCDSLTWTSSDDSVLHVERVTNRSKACTLKILKNGAATVKVTAPGGVSDWIDFTVYLPIHVTDVSMNYASVSLWEGNGWQLGVTVLPRDADDKSVTWASSDPAVAQVDEYGYVTGVRDGKAYITATTNDGGKTATCEVQVSTRDPIEAFVYRMYRVCLQREPDPDGFAGWVSALKKGPATGAQLAYSFLCSDEMAGRRLSDGDYVERTYEATMGRASDAEGKAAWVQYLEDGLSRKAVVSGFVKSGEFGLLCEKYGIVQGDYTSDEPRDRNAGAAAYVARLYTKMLGRAFDADGLNAWCAAVLHAPTKETLLAVALNGFMHSEEFAGKGLDDIDFVRVLYPTFLGRDPDSAGVQAWVEALRNGSSRDDVAAGFAYSPEFAAIMAQYGF